MKRSLRILIFVSQYPPDVNSTGLLMHRLSKGLVGRGHEVHVVSTFPHYAAFRVPEQYRGRIIQRSIEDGIHVTRVWVFASGQKQRMWHRLVNYLTYNVGAFLAAQSSAADYDVALATSTSFFTGITSWLLGVLRGFPYVYNVQDIYPDVPARAGQLKSKWQIAGLDAIGSFMHAQAAQVTAISDEMRLTLIRKGVPAEKVSVIHNFVDVHQMRPVLRDEKFAARFGWNGKLVVMHGGNIGFAYDFDSILAAAHRLRDRDDIRFVIMGEGVRKAALQARVAAENLTNVQILPYQPHSDLPQVRACSDVQLSLYRRGSSEFSLPSKLYEIMACGRPVLASAEPASEVTRLIRNADAGLVIEPENVDALVEAITALQREPQRREQLGRNGREFVVAHHSDEAAVEAYEACLLRTVQQH